MNEYQKRDYDAMQLFARELSAFYPAQVIPHDDHHIIVMTRNGKQYQVRKGWKGEIDVFEYPYMAYPRVSHSTRGEIVKEHKTQNMRVLSQKKLDAKMDAIDTIHATLTAKEEAATDKRADFLKALDACGVPVTYHHDTRTDFKDGERITIKGEITGGYMVRNGIEFTFSFSQDGYISQKVEVHYSANNNIHTFLKLSDNKYTGKISACGHADNSGMCDNCLPL